MAAAGAEGERIHNVGLSNTSEQKNYLAFEENVTAECDVHIEDGKKKRVPRRIIHFIDGSTQEEYSTDEEEEVKAPPPVDPSTLDWLRWFWYWFLFCATKSLAGADFLGEKLAGFFGITTPKYQYILDEYQRIQEEETANVSDDGISGATNSGYTSHQGDDVEMVSVSPRAPPEANYPQ